MKIVLVFVMSLDGKITKWFDPDIKPWTSQEDKNYFKKVWDDAKLIVMGSKTYNVDRVTPNANHLVVVMTKRPEMYHELKIEGKLEFIGDSPEKLVDRYKNAGYKEMFVVGGAHIATSFLKKQLVDELWLTIEPRLFGKGDTVITEESLDVKLKLIQSDRMNENGTLINKYIVL